MAVRGRGQEQQVAEGYTRREGPSAGGEGGGGEEEMRRQIRTRIRWCPKSNSHLKYKLFAPMANSTGQSTS